MINFIKDLFFSNYLWYRKSQKCTWYGYYREVSEYIWVRKKPESYEIHYGQIKIEKENDES